MSEPIDFPMNFERYMEMGQLALAEGVLDEALLNFEGAYNLREDFQANQLLVRVLMARSEFAEAKKIAEEMKLDYLAASETFRTYLTILIGTQSFIQGRKLLRRSQFAPELEADFLAEIEEGESFFRKFQGKELGERQALGKDLGELSFYQQAGRLRAMEQLPLSEYLELAKGLIEEASLPLLLNNGLIETLVELGSQMEVSSQTIRGRQVIALAELPLINQQMSYQACLTSLRAQVDNHDSELSHSLEEELRLQFILLYPLADQLITTPALWVKLFLASYLGDELAERNSEVEGFLELQGALRKELAYLAL